MKNKVLIIFLLIITLISFCTVSFCSYDITLNDTVFKFPDEFGQYPYRLFLNFNSDKYCYFFAVSNTPFYITNFTDERSFWLHSSEIFYKAILNSSSHYSDIITDFSDVSIDFPASLVNGSYVSAFNFNGNNSDFIVFTSHDIKDTEGNVVFHRAPVEYLEPMKTQEVKEIPQMIIKLAMAILPAILMIVGIFLVIYLMRYKIFSNF